MDKRRSDVPSDAAARRPGAAGKYFDHTPPPKLHFYDLGKFMYGSPFFCKRDFEEVARHEPTRPQPADPRLIQPARVRDLGLSECQSMIHLS